MKKLGILLLVTCSFVGQMEAFIIGSTLATPEVYTVGIRKLSFRNADTLEIVVCSDVVDFNDGVDVPMNIAAVSAGAAVGIFGDGCILPDGTYDQMIFLVESTMTTKGAVHYNSGGQNSIVSVAPDLGTVQITVGESPDTYEIEVNVALSTAIATGNTAAEQLAIVQASLVSVGLATPTEEDALPADFASETINGLKYFQGVMPLIAGDIDASFTVVDGSFPIIQLDFGVENRLEFFYESGTDTFIVTLQGPDVAVIVDGVRVVVADEG